MVLAVKEEAEATADDRTDAHIRRVVERMFCSCMRKSRCKGRIKKDVVGDGL